ncbi:MAG: hypothetical protein KAS32_13630 [Candidatus Peribacteraceae bacterium]|nr:hypothetical protein [Candidatus Peribacteraceae bacterium]
MITETGMAAAVDLIGDVTGSEPPFDHIFIGWGTGSDGAESASHTGLQGTNESGQEDASPTRDSTGGATNDTLVLDATGFQPGAVTVNEIGMFDGSTGTGTDIMMCREKLTTGIALGGSDTLDVTYKLTAQQGS